MGSLRIVRVSSAVAYGACFSRRKLCGVVTDGKGTDCSPEKKNARARSCASACRIAAAKTFLPLLAVCDHERRVRLLELTRPLRHDAAVMPGPSLVAIALACPSDAPAVGITGSHIIARLHTFPGIGIDLASLACFSSPARRANVRHDAAVMPAPSLVALTLACPSNAPAVGITCSHIIACLGALLLLLSVGFLMMFAQFLKTL